MDAEHILRVSDVITSNGRWNLHQLCTNIPREIVKEVLSVPLGMLNGGQDKLIWQLTQDGNFSVKSVYDLLATLVLHDNRESKWVWRCRAPEKIQMIIWLACRGRLHTQVLRKRRGLSDTDTCLLCLDACEDELHVLCDCN